MELGIRVAFAGHNRAEDIGGIDQATRVLHAGFACLREAGVQTGVLLTGLADGADLLAVAEWRKLGLGAVHGVMPHLEDSLPADPALQPDRITWLDGASVERAGRSPHALQTRWLLEDADILLVYWNGEIARGPGGTADAVWSALQRGVPVLWVEPKEPSEPRLIFGEALEENCGYLELLDRLSFGDPTLMELATRERVAALLGSLALAAPKLPSSDDQGLPLLDRVLERTVFRTFSLYRRLVGGGRPPAPHLAAPPPELQQQPGFQILTRAYEAADIQANRLAAIHRSQQVFQAAVMILAAAIGSAPAIWPGIKIYCVLTELALAYVTFQVWSVAVKSEQGRRWGEARRVAEQLRLERASWALGLSTRLDGRGASSTSPARSAWCWRRKAQSPDGRFDAARVQAWGRWALASLIEAEREYHHVQGRLNARLSHRAHAFETKVFWLFIGLLVSFAVLFGLAKLLDFELPHWFGGLVLVAGAVTPAFGAASLALDSSLALSDQARRSANMEASLSVLAERAKSADRLDLFQSIGREALVLQIQQEDRWSEEAAHRQVLRAG